MKSKNTHHIIEIIASCAFLFLPLFLFPTVKPMVEEGALNPALTGIIITHSLLIGFYYFNFYFAIPRFYFNNKKKQYALILLTCLTTLIVLLMMDHRFNPFPSPPFKYADFTFAFSIFIRFMVVLLVSMGVAHIQRLKQTEQEKVQSELAYLKAQINPHFLFNTLNSIYALRVYRSDAAPESITKLSSIMRYVMSETSAALVALDKEIKYLQSYIDLERLRLTDKVKLDFKVEGDLTGKRISPLIFLPLIENAFKHGVSTVEECDIRIHITVSGNLLNLEVANNKPRTESRHKTGLGVDNVKKRLLLLYPGKHELKIKETSSTYLVNLVMVLND
jgi:hypothetical protein